ncbi:MAG: hypothetical protein M3406_16705 [Chloroflexota bacterium]|nr:hypothetical protein [Chloroflexota bacterium]
MSHRAPPIARIRLSRSFPRLLVLPVSAAVIGLGAVGMGVLYIPGIVGLVVAGLGAIVILMALAGAVVLLSIRLEVEEAAVCLAWLGTERIYPLSPGPVTRVRLQGDNASRLRAAPTFLPWQLGAGRLRGEEDVEVVRLAPTATAILVPTERGRLAIAAADEDALLDALSRAARARQRLEELIRDSPADETPERPDVSSEVATEFMTGIERARFERRMAAEVTAATAAAEEMDAHRSTEAAEPQAPPEPVAARPARLRQRRGLPRPAWARWPAPSAGLPILPLLGAGIVLGLAATQDRMPQPGTDLGRLTALALVLGGPATTVGAFLARVWWPRLVAVVVAGGLAATVFVGRALLG